jgi:hypothetical protein
MITHFSVRKISWKTFLRNQPRRAFSLSMTKNSPFILAGAAALFSTTLARSQDSTTPPVVGNVMISGSELAEEAPAGVAGEPTWTHNRRFSTTRIYIQKDPGEIGVEQWYRVRTFDGGNVTQRSQTEIEIGLPYRMQFDLYENVLLDNATGKGWQQEEVAAELRFAFADWGVLPLNPTFYFEYAFAHEGADGIEPKLLIGDDFGSGWHWGVNFIHERRVWGDAKAEWGIAGGISKTIVDSCFSVGFEGKWTHPEGGPDEGIVGPTIQWLPTANTHLDLIAMAGVNDSSPNAECWFIFGYDFGSGAKKQQGYKPTSVAGN